MWVFIVSEEVNVPADDEPMIKPLTQNQSNAKLNFFLIIIADDTLHRTVDKRYSAIKVAILIDWCDKCVNKYKL